MAFQRCYCVFMCSLCCSLILRVIPAALTLSNSAAQQSRGYVHVVLKQKFVCLFFTVINLNRVFVSVGDTKENTPQHHGIFLTLSVSNLLLSNLRRRKLKIFFLFSLEI